MRIAYDSATRKATVSFRGRIAVIYGTYALEDEAIAAGEMFCRQLGWRPDARPKSTTSTIDAGGLNHPRMWTAYVVLKIACGRTPGDTACERPKCLLRQPIWSPTLG